MGHAPASSAAVERHGGDGETGDADQHGHRRQRPPGTLQGANARPMVGSLSPGAVVLVDMPRRLPASLVMASQISRGPLTTGPRPGAGMRPDRSDDSA
jgi:hypothetical protein